ncbi:MAG: hypothetical protein K2X27_00555 [Candidatus Obscuribacterales bacterium]|nr:hypothetical protein [Candidatus Obscuribacterales bacterium]
MEPKADESPAPVNGSDTLTIDGKSPLDSLFADSPEITGTLSDPLSSSTSSSDTLSSIDKREEPLIAPSSSSALVPDLSESSSSPGEQVPVLSMELPAPEPHAQVVSHKEPTGELPAVESSSEKESVSATPSADPVALSAASVELSPTPAEKPPVLTSEAVSSTKEPVPPKTIEAPAPMSVELPAPPPPAVAATSPALPASSAAPTGVAGIVMKLEQQSQRATARLEQRLDEMQSKLQDERQQAIAQVLTKEQASQKNIESMRTVLSRRLNAAADEIKTNINDGAEKGCQNVKDSSSSASASLAEQSKELGQEVLKSFDELSNATVGLLSTHTDKAEASQVSGLSEMNSLASQMKEKIEDITRQHYRSMQGQFEHLEKRCKEINEFTSDELNKAGEKLAAELSLHKKDCVDRLEALSNELVSTINEGAALCGLNIQIHADSLGTSTLVPRLLQMKQSLGANAQKLREQYKEEVEKSAALKMAELRPVFVGSRERMDAVINEAQQLRIKIQEEQKSEFEKILQALTIFVEEKLSTASGAARLILDELSVVEKQIMALSDSSSIESDPELSAARSKVLARLQEIGSQLQDRVNDSLRRQIADMEDKGRMLQEELISSMEADAYAVRKSVEASVQKVKQAIEQASSKISSLQNQYLQ